MARLLLVDTSDALPGLLPLHSWSALMTSDLVLTASSEHPFVPHLEMAELRHEVVPTPDEGATLLRADLLSGLAPADKARAEWVIGRVREVGEVTYLFGPDDAEAFTRTLGMEAANAQVEVEVVYFGVAPKGTRLLELVRVQARLRAPDGCPWDREQTHESLGRYAIEEVYELLEAIATGEPDDLREELGDVLLQVMFHAQVAEDAGTFDIDAVAGGIADKLVRRHPHVFGDTEVADSGEVMRNWEDLKIEEKPERTGPFDGVPTAQPALQLTDKYQRRAAKRGLDVAGVAEAAGHVSMELQEVLSARVETRGEAVGDLLASVVSLARHAGVDPESALRGSAARFRDRFQEATAHAGKPLEELSREEWRDLWSAQGS